MSSNTSNESPKHSTEELPLSPSAYYNLIPLTAQLPLNVAREVLTEATARHKEELLPTSPHMGLNILCNADCTVADATEVAKGLAATIKNRENFHNLHTLFYEEQIAKLQKQIEDHPDNRDHPNDDHPRFAAAPVGFTINASHLLNATLPAR